MDETRPFVCFCRDQHQLFVRTALAADEGLVSLHERAEWIAVGAHHRGSQLVQPGPRRLVGTEAHDEPKVLA